MRKSIILILFILVGYKEYKESFCQRLKDITIFYHDTVSVNGKSFYRELKQIGEDPFWSKPEEIDIVLTVEGKSKSAKEKIEILIEELYEPSNLNQLFNTIKEKTWVPHKVIYSGNTNFIKDGKIKVSNVSYKTAYFNSSLFYTKIGFRFVAIYYDATTRKIETIKEEIYYPM